ncbi:MAG: hypothetical protein IT449_06160 [Phycisphaerales bacterium]|nr:hypothetical protein [Phycisphaerales bacterium]
MASLNDLQAAHAKWGPRVAADCFTGEIRLMAHSNVVDGGRRPRLSAIAGRGRALRATMVLGVGLTVSRDLDRLQAQCTPTERILPSNWRGSGYGQAVALTDESLLIGCPYGNEDFVEAFVSEGNHWSLVQQISPPSTWRGSSFGASLAIFGDTLLVGSSSYSAPSVVVYSRVGGSWVERQQLPADDGDDQYGRSLSLDGGVAIIGAPQAFQGEGRAHLFTRDGSGPWQRVARLKAADATNSDQFGTAVSVKGDCALIGAPWSDDLGSSSGSAYVFRNTGGIWVEEAKLLGSETNGEDHLGQAVAVHGEWAAVGAPNAWHRAAESGVVEMFRFVDGAWEHFDRLFAADGRAYDMFGSSLVLQNGVLCVGAPQHDFSTGTVHVFRFNGRRWEECEVWTAGDDDQYGQKFGLSIAATATRTAVGGPPGGTGAGAAFAMELDCMPRCTRREEIHRVRCRTRNERWALVFRLTGGLPRDLVEVKLDSGKSKSTRLALNGEGRIRWRTDSPPVGSATVRWGCGAVEEATFSCP